MSPVHDDTDRLVTRAAGGDHAALHDLFNRHRNRLRGMIAVHLDARVSARVDPSDILQEAFVVAAARMTDYSDHRPIPFYPWLRRITWERLVDAHKRHITACKRSVAREIHSVGLSDASATALVGHLADSRTDPLEHLLRAEMRCRVHEALARLSATEREVLVMRHLEHMPIREIAQFLGASEAAVKMRRLRAAEKLRSFLNDAR